MFRDIRKFCKREGLLKLIIKFLDYFLRPFGILISSFFSFKNRSFKKNLNFEKNYKYNFLKIYKYKTWKTDKNLSGTSSDLFIAKYYALKLREFFIRKKIKSVFDCGCGEFMFMDMALKDLKLKYIGGDLVNNILFKNKINFPRYKFIEFDILKDKLPKVQLLHIRDCLFHFSFIDIHKALNNFCNSKIKFLLITSHNSLILKNYDIVTGDFRYLDFSKKPFYFRNEILKIKDFIFPYFPKYSYLWSNSQIKKFLRNFNE